MPAVSELTDEEKVKILEETHRLIKEPANWITGRWKCPVYERDPENRRKFLRDADGNKVRAYDKLNRPQAQYCIEGAVNQATIHVMGEERARKIGVSRDGQKMTEQLGLNALARELTGNSRGAMSLNDSFRGGDTPKEKKARKEEGHRTILSLVQTGLDRLKGK